MSKKNRDRSAQGNAPRETAPSGMSDWNSIYAQQKPAFTTERIEAAAKAAHEANREYCQTLGDNSQVSWEDAPDWQKQSAINGVQFAIDNNFPSPKKMHENWMAEKAAAGWVYGEVKDPEKKTHPCMVPFADLPPEQRYKDELFQGTIIASLPSFAGSPPAEAEGPAADPNVAGDDVLDLDKAGDGDEEQGGDKPTGAPVFEREWNLCLTLAFAGTELNPLTNWLLTTWEGVPFEMSRFITDHRDAPDEAVLIHIKRKLKVAILVNEDQRRVHLAIQLFRHWLIGMQAIASQNAAAAEQKWQQAQASAQGAPRIDPEDQTFAIDKGPFEELSDLGRAAARKAE